MTDPHNQPAKDEPDDMFNHYPEIDMGHVHVFLEKCARDRCYICDDDGYRPNGRVCDHVDRTEIAARGIAKVRAALRSHR